MEYGWQLGSRSERRRFGDAESMSAEDIDDPNSEAGHTTEGASPTAKLSISFLE